MQRSARVSMVLIRVRKGMKDAVFVLFFCLGTAIFLCFIALATRVSLVEEIPVD